MRRRLNAYLRGRKPEDLHQFRVQVKKLQAFLVLYRHSTRHKLNTAFKPVKKIFKKAGTLRNAYVVSNLVHRTDVLKGLDHSFAAKKKVYRKRLKKAFKAFQKNIRRIKPAFTRSFYQDQLKQITDTMATTPSPAQLHECRKRIKILLYNEHLVHDMIPMCLNTAYLDQVQEKIGDWHDQFIAAAPANADKIGEIRVMIDQLTRDLYHRAIDRGLAVDEDH